MKAGELGAGGVFAQPADLPQDSDYQIDPERVRVIYPSDKAEEERPDRFQPMMNYAWPVHLAWRLGEREAAALMERHAGCATLLEVTGEDGETGYAIGLGGGGMDLSFDICMGYICCGQLPPARLMEDLPNYSGGMGRRERRVLACAGRVAGVLRDRASRIQQQAKRLRASRKREREQRKVREAA
jgi:hypothetical protein